jgi:hypothetical protein
MGTPRNNIIRAEFKEHYEAVTMYFLIHEGDTLDDGSFYGVFETHRRADLVDAMRDAVEYYGMPRNTLYQHSWADLWAKVKKVGLFGVSLKFSHAGKHLNFIGLSETEFKMMKLGANYTEFGLINA